MRHRERVAFDREQAARLAHELTAEGGEAVVLATCNRTEVYAVAADAERPFREAGVESAVYRLHDEGAALHLFRVAAGLDSMVPGEGEILGQVRQAFERGTPGPLLDRAFRPARSASRKSRSSRRPGEPASYAVRTCPRISPSPGTIESRPAATRKRWRAAAWSVSV